VFLIPFCALLDIISLANLKEEVNMERRPNRSDKYQYLINEVTITNEFMESFSNVSSISHMLNPFEYSEELENAKEELKKEVWKLAKTVMTDNQFKIFGMLSQGLTQWEIAKILDVNQSSITKSVNGNIDYKNGQKIYGGFMKKMKKAVSESPEIQNILNKISDLTYEKF